MSTPTDPITARAHARAGLVGNPSDGYFGKTVSFIIRDFAATVTLTPGDRFVIEPGEMDAADYPSVDAFLRERKLFGYYGAQRLMKAAVVKFLSHFTALGDPVDPADRPPFSLRFQSDIPRLVGLSGSSAIVTATLRALMQYYGRDIPREQLPAVTLSAERDELGITAGLQDRVIQAYEGLVYMDFDRDLVTATGNGRYEPLTPAGPLPVYVAYDAERAEVSDVAHRNLRKLFDSGDAEVVGAMAKFADFAERGRAAILSGDWDVLHEVTDANYDLRTKIMPIAPENQRMIDVARSAGASAKFAGSGGAICGVYHGDDGFRRLSDALASIGCRVLKPTIFA